MDLLSCFLACHRELYNRPAQAGRTAKKKRFLSLSPPSFVRLACRPAKIPLVLHTGGIVQIENNAWPMIDPETGYYRTRWLDVAPILHARNTQRFQQSTAQTHRDVFMHAPFSCALACRSRMWSSHSTSTLERYRMQLNHSQPIQNKHRVVHEFAMFMQRPEESMIGHEHMGVYWGKTQGRRVYTCL
jgi:hypothetical protein